MISYREIFPSEFSASVSPIIILEMHNVVRITWAKKKENAVWKVSTGECIFHLKHQPVLVFYESPIAKSPGYH